MAGGWVSAGETVLIDSEEPPSRRSKLGGPAPGPLFSSLYPFSALSLPVSRRFSLSFSFSLREQTWLLRTSASPLATLDSYPSYPSFPFFPVASRRRFQNTPTDLIFNLRSIIPRAMNFLVLQITRNASRKEYN